MFFFNMYMFFKLNELLKSLLLTLVGVKKTNARKKY
jgi:hypothetical protein